MERAGGLDGHGGRLRAPRPRERGGDEGRRRSRPGLPRCRGEPRTKGRSAGVRGGEREPRARARARVWSARDCAAPASALLRLRVRAGKRPGGQARGLAAALPGSPRAVPAPEAPAGRITRSLPGRPARAGFLHPRGEACLIPRCRLEREPRAAPRLGRTAECAGSASRGSGPRARGKGLRILGPRLPKPLPRPDDHVWKGLSGAGRRRSAEGVARVRLGRGLKATRRGLKSTRAWSERGRGVA